LNLVRKAYTHVEFKTVFLYTWMRHPMMLGQLKYSVVGFNARTMDFLTPSACPAARPPFPG
jgi:hypothetical protein